MKKPPVVMGRPTLFEERRTITIRLSEAAMAVLGRLCASNDCSQSVAVDALLQGKLVPHKGNQKLPKPQPLAPKNLHVRAKTKKATAKRRSPIKGTRKQASRKK